jgi:hypothetical protein
LAAAVAEFRSLTGRLLLLRVGSPPLAEQMEHEKQGVGRDRASLRRQVLLDRIEESSHGRRSIGLGGVDRLDRYPIAFVQLLDDLHRTHGPLRIVCSQSFRSETAWTRLACPDAIVLRNKSRSVMEQCGCDSSGWPLFPGARAS